MFDELYHTKETLCSELYVNIDRLIDEVNIGNRRIVVFGITEVHNVAIRYLQEKGITIEAILDNCPARKGMAIQGIEVFAPKDLMLPFDDRFVVLIGGNYYEVMTRQLEKMGYRRDQHIFRIFSPDKAVELPLQKGYREITFAEERQLQLGAMAHLKKKCRECGINYYLAYGTLIGAIRHHGFIPWDNDIDVFIKEDNLMKLYESIREDDDYTLLLPGVTDNYISLTALYVDKRTLTQLVDFPFIVNTGVGVDIMPLVNMGNSWEEAEEFLKQSYPYVKRFKQQLLVANESEKAFQYMKDCIVYSEQKKNEECSYVGGLYGLTEARMQILKKEWFADANELPFEDEVFATPIGADALLRQVYGDYMKLPPEEQRNAANHPWKNYWKQQ